MAIYLLPEREFGRRELLDFDLVMIDYPTFNQNFPSLIENREIEVCKDERHYYGEETTLGQEYVAMISGENSKIQLIGSTLRTRNGRKIIKELIEEFKIKRYISDINQKEGNIQEFYAFIETLPII